MEVTGEKNKGGSANASPAAARPLDCARCGLPIISRPVLVVETGILHEACAAEDEAEWEASRAAWAGG